MTITIFGAVLAVIGFWIVLRSKLHHVLWYLGLSGLLGGSAAVQIGSSSIQPMQFALAFAILRILMPSGGYVGAVPASFRQNLALVVFVGYGIASAFFAPRIFAGDINVTPLRVEELRSIFDTYPLYPTAQNVTAAIYLVGTLAMALVAYIVVRFRGGAKALVDASIAIVWVHGLTGIVGVLARGTPLQVVFDFARNANYAQVEQSYQGFIRINGIFPEPSSYAAFGLGWFFFTAECWFRGIRPRATGVATLFMALVLLFSTSSTAYVGLGAYVVFFVLRLAALPTPENRKRGVAAFIAMFGLVCIGCVFLILVPSLPVAIWDMLMHMTLNKQDSDSGQQRYFWAMQGLDAFVVSGGLGIGPGSFRSSSILLAIIGSMGVIGILAFAAYIWRVLDPRRASTWTTVADPALNIGGAAAIAALFKLVPAAVSAATPDPGMLFSLFAGAALALRPMTRGLPKMEVNYKPRPETEPSQ